MSHLEDTLNFNYDEEVTRGRGGTLNGDIIITLTYPDLIFSLSDGVKRDLKGKYLETLDNFIQQNKDHKDIEIVNLFIEALNIFDTFEGSNFTKLNLLEYRTYLINKEAIRYGLVLKNKQLKQQIEDNLQQITTRNETLKSNLKNILLVIFCNITT